MELTAPRLPGRRRTAAVGGAAALLHCLAGPGHTQGASPLNLHIDSLQLLSNRGSTRATRYSGTNKIVTLDGKTHLAWLDSLSETMVATYDHAADKWGAPVRVGTGYDNHGGPALACDSRGYLHVIFGPHGGPFQHARSTKPNDSSQWTKLPDFGVEGTYPSFVCDDRDTLHLIYRGGGDPHRLLYQRLPKDGAWSKPVALAAAPIKSGYTHYHASLTIARDQALHVAYDIYYSGAAKCAGHLMSRNRGDTWLLADGSRPELPITPESDAFFKRVDDALKVGGIVCDAGGHPWVTVTGPEIHYHDGSKWNVIDPASRLDPPAKPSDGPTGTNAPTIDASGNLYLPVYRGREVALLHSSDRGETFRMLDIFPADEKLPHVGLSLERPTGHNEIGVPWLLFSTGEKGPDCFGKGIFHKVWAVRLRAQ